MKGKTPLKLARELKNEMSQIEILKAFENNPSLLLPKGDMLELILERS